MNPRTVSVLLSALSGGLCLPVFGPTLRAEVLIDRIFMPHGASPSSFAIGLPGGVGFCFDPLRVAVSYVWTGGFIDATPARPGLGKFTDAAKLLGPIVYRESGAVPLRREDRGRVPTVEFTGYTLKSDAVEFRYTVDGQPVREEIRLRADGRALVRTLHVAGGGDARWWHVVAGQPAQALNRTAGGALRLELPLAETAATR